MTSEFHSGPKIVMLIRLQTSYFQAYLNFFTQIVQKRGAIAAVEEYIFSVDSNFIRCHGGAYPVMLSRCLALTLPDPYRLWD
jgi:hypothetical protein